jgi:hypothetical protein
MFRMRTDDPDQFRVVSAGQGIFEISLDSEHCGKLTLALDDIVLFSSEPLR